MNKRVKEIDQELDALFACMEELPKDSDEYKKIQNRYGDFLRMKEDVKTSKKAYLIFRDILTIVLKASGTIVMPAWLALLAYNNDEELKMVNQRVWNIATKFLFRKEST